jgi:CTP-dependent riboflavin kinase
VLLIGRVQPGKGDASHWLSRFNTEYSAKLGIPVYPGSLNIALSQAFDWYAPAIAVRSIWFGMEEYGGERDILLVPAVIESLADQAAFLWTTTTASKDPSDTYVVELISSVHLRSTFALCDGDEIRVRLLDQRS